jgi:hypothetical protein
MPNTAYSNDLDSTMALACGETFSSMRRHQYACLPVETDVGFGDVPLHSDSYGRQLHKAGAVSSSAIAEH